MCAYCIGCFGLGVAVVLLLAWYTGVMNDATQTIFWNGLKWPREGYAACDRCDKWSPPAGGVGVINPFIWPYSGASCVSDLYVLAKNQTPEVQPLTHLTTPDHVEMV